MSISKSDQVLIDSAKDLAQTYDEVKAKFERMRSQLQSMESQWVGSGGRSFQGAIAAWDNKQRQVLRSLEEFSGSLSDAESTYSVTESDVDSVFNKYTTGLG